MKIFIQKTLLFFTPFILLVLIAISADFFKVFGFRDDYYTDTGVNVNREMVCTKTYNHFREAEQFNSFIFGSSRSQAFKCENWSKYLENDATPFHFDASSEGVWGIANKIEYIDELGDNIENAIIVLDRAALTKTKINKGHIFIPMPCVSKISPYEYYSTFLVATLNAKFAFAYLDYSIFKTHRKYMGATISKFKYSHTVNPTNCDLWLGYDKEIELDSAEYYNRLKERGVFYKRPQESSYKCPVTVLEVEQLNKIKTVFSKHNTKFKVVISPLYDQIPLEQDQLDLLVSIFGKDAVYDFSGKNELTEPITNYYETSHFRPHVANIIFKAIYEDCLSNRKQEAEQAFSL